jgi:hypothetical protein
MFAWTIERRFQRIENKLKHLKIPIGELDADGDE